jgi:hypothetical protein
MALEIKKLKELEYDALITLAVIESDSDLTEIFADEVSLSFAMLTTLSKNGELSEQVKELLVSLFNDIICSSKVLVSNYIKFGGKVLGDIPVEIIEPVAEFIPTPVSTRFVLDVVEEPKVEAKTKKEKATSKWYGKERLLKEIAEQGGKANPTQRAMLELNDLKNIYSSLLARGIKNLETENVGLTDNDCRLITSVITTAKRQLAEILKKK